MDWVFQLGEADLVSFLFNLMNSCGSCYICLWSYSSSHNWLKIKFAHYYDHEADSSAAAGAQRLFYEYQQRPVNIVVENNFVPGLVFKQQSPYLELEEAQLQRLAFCEPQRQFYQEARIKTAIFMGCRSGEIELGLNKVPQMNLEAVMKNLFRGDLSRQSPSKDRLLSYDQSYEQNYASSSSSLSTPMDSPEYPSILFNIPISSSPNYHVLPQPQPQPQPQDHGRQQSQLVGYGDDQLQQIPLPRAESTDAAITRAILAILSTPANSSSSSTHQQISQESSAAMGAIGKSQNNVSAFISYKRAVLDPSRQIISSAACSVIRRPNLMKRAIEFCGKLSRYQRLQRQHQQQAAAQGARGGHPPANQMHHMISERRRREKINQSFQALRTFLPPQTKKDKASILKATQEYLSSLKAQISELDKRNQELEAKLLSMKSSSSRQQEVQTDLQAGTCANERFRVQIVPAAESSSGARMVDLQVIHVIEDISILDLVVKILEFLKQVSPVTVISIEAQSHPAGGQNQVTLRLRIQESEWDESAFKDAVKRLLDADFA